MFDMLRLFGLACFYDKDGGFTINSETFERYKPLCMDLESLGLVYLRQLDVLNKESDWILRMRKDAYTGCPDD